jgi:hypothetical protein
VARALTYGPQPKPQPPSLAELPAVDPQELAEAAEYLRALAAALDLIRTGKPKGKPYEGNATHDLALAWYLWTGGGVDVYALDLGDEFDEGGNSRADPRAWVSSATSEACTLPPRADEGLEGQERFDRWNGAELSALLGTSIERLLGRERREGSRPYLPRFDALAHYRGGRSVYAQNFALAVAGEIAELKAVAYSRHRKA